MDHRKLNLALQQESYSSTQRKGNETLKMATGNIYHPLQYMTVQI